MMRIAIALLALAAATSAIAQTVSKPDGAWRGSLGASLTSSDGNNESTSASLSADAVRQRDRAVERKRRLADAALFVGESNYVGLRAAAGLEIAQHHSRVLVARATVVCGLQKGAALLPVQRHQPTPRWANRLCVLLWISSGLILISKNDSRVL